MNNVISTIIKFVTTGADVAARGIAGVNKAAGVATRSMATLASSLGSMGGSLGKAAGQVANFMMSIQQMGAVGGIIAGAQMAITQISDHFIEKANKMKEAVEKMADRVRTKLEDINNAHLDGVRKSLEEVTTKAKEAAASFDEMAASYLKMQDAANATAKSGNSVKASALALEKSKAMAGETDADRRAVVGAGYDVRIAQENAKSVRDEQDRAVARAKEEERNAYGRQALAGDNVKKAEKAVKKASLEKDLAKEAGNDESTVARYEDLYRKARKALADAVKEKEKADTEAAIAPDRVIQAENARIVAINDATRGLVEARAAEDNLVRAQTAAAKAELERAKAAEKSARLEIKSQKPETDRASVLSQARDTASSRFSSAFDLWRDPSAAQQAQDAARTKSDDLKRFQKSVDRYGGKWRIDEAAKLMLNGDEAGLQERLAEWRKSSKFNGQTEQMVLAAAARQNEHSAEKSLAEIQKSSASIEKQLQEIKKAFEGGEQ